MRSHIKKKPSDATAAELAKMIAIKLKRTAEIRRRRAERGAFDVAMGPAYDASDLAPIISPEGEPVLYVPTDPLTPRGYEGAGSGVADVMMPEAYEAIRAAHNPGKRQIVAVNRADWDEL